MIAARIKKRTAASNKADPLYRNGSHCLVSIKEGDLKSGNAVDRFHTSGTSSGLKILPLASSM